MLGTLPVLIPKLSQEVCGAEALWSPFYRGGSERAQMGLSSLGYAGNPTALASPPCLAGPTPGQVHGQQPVNGLREWLGTNYKRHRQHSQEEPQVTGCWSLVGADLYHPGQHGGLDPVRLGAVVMAQILPQG